MQNSRVFVHLIFFLNDPFILREVGKQERSGGMQIEKKGLAMRPVRESYILGKMNKVDGQCGE